MKLNTASGLGVIVVSNSSRRSDGMLGVFVIDGVSVMVGLRVIVGDNVMVGVSVTVGVCVGVGEGEIKR